MPPHAAPAANSHGKSKGTLALRVTAELLYVFLCFAIFFAACRSNRHTYDPRLRKIDELLNAQLPAGTPRGRVEYFLSARGYEREDAADKTLVRALVRHVDPDTLQPAAAHVTFHFDSSGQLTTYELQPASVAPLQERPRRIRYLRMSLHSPQFITPYSRMDQPLRAPCYS